MRIYFYYKVDRGGYYESACTSWHREGGDFADRLLRMQPMLYPWKREFERLGCTVMMDLRSSYVLPQTRRCHLPMPLAKLLRAGLWISRADPWLLQRDIIEQIDSFRPDIAFFPLGSSVWESTLEVLKKRGVKLVQWCGLPANTMMERDRANLPYFDLIFQPYSDKMADGLRAAGAVGRIEHVSLGVDPEIYRPVALTPADYKRYQSDVCFIGGLGNRYHSSRRKTIEYAIEHGVDMKIWGGYREHFRGSPILRCWQGQIWGEEQVKALCATKIGLNFHPDHESGEMDRGLNLRAFELVACSIFQLMQYVPGVNEFFQVGKEIVCFGSREEMLDKVKYYLAHEHERETIAHAGRTRVIREHTWTHRVQQMLQYANELVATS